MTSGAHISVYTTSTYVKILIKKLADVILII